MQQDITLLLAVVCARGCSIQIGTDMFFEVIPVDFEFFGFGAPTP